MHLATATLLALPVPLSWDFWLDFFFPFYLCPYHSRPCQITGPTWQPPSEHKKWKVSLHAYRLLAAGQLVGFLVFSDVGGDAFVLKCFSWLFSCVSSRCLLSPWKLLISAALSIKKTFSTKLYVGVLFACVFKISNNKTEKTVPFICLELDAC